MEKVYKDFAELAGGKQEDFNELIAIQKRIIKREAELYNLQMEKKSIAQKLIVYLQKNGLDGIRNTPIIAYLQSFSGGTPSFWEVFNAVSSKICNEDKAKLISTYTNLGAGKEKTIGLVVKGVV